ncbi:MAG: hypothetical protein U0X58_10470 [Flavobacteriaceae bacterium]
MKSKITMLAGLMGLCIMLNSCGVMFGGSRYEASITAKDRPNADIYVDGQKIGKGQATTMYSRNRQLTVELREEGCETTTQTFDKRFRTGNFILSLVSWGIIGIGVDLGTGASYKPDHKNNPAIKKINTKKFSYTVDSSCKK